MAILSREQIKGFKDISEITVSVPEWDGGEVIIKPFTLEERSKVRELSKVYNEKTGQMEIDSDRLDLITFITGVRSPEFTMDDFFWLKNEKNGGAIARVVRVIAQKSGMLPDTESDVRKNSKTNPQSEINSNLPKEKVAGFGQETQEA